VRVLGLCGFSGSAGWFGNVPSSSPYMTSKVTLGKRSITAGTTRPPIPLAVSATTCSGRIEPTSLDHTTWYANALNVLRAAVEPGRGDGAGPFPDSTSNA